MIGSERRIRVVYAFMEDSQCLFQVQTGSNSIVATHALDLILIPVRHALHAADRATWPAARDSNFRWCRGGLVDAIGSRHLLS